MAVASGLRPSEFFASGEDDKALLIAYHRVVAKMNSYEAKEREREMKRKERYKNYRGGRG